MRIDRSHRKWLVASLVILGAATFIYIPYALHSPAGPSGRSAVGLVFGIVGSTFMLFSGLLAARKKVPIWRVGSTQTWMRGHLWLGLLSLPLILFHGGFRFGGPLTSVLMVLVIIVIASGVFGAVLQHYLPGVMTVQVPFETIFEQIDSVRGQLLAEADEFVAVVYPSLNPVTATSPRRMSGPANTAAVSEDEAEPLHGFYLTEIRPFLQHPDARRHVLADPEKAREVFEGLRILLPPSLQETVKDLEDICEEERQLRRQVRLHHWLHGWLMLHVPLSLALLLLGAAHAVMALRY